MDIACQVPVRMLPRDETCPALLPLHLRATSPSMFLALSLGISLEEDDLLDLLPML